MTITRSACPAMLGIARCSLPAMLETPDALTQLSLLAASGNDFDGVKA